MAVATEVAVTDHPAEGEEDYLVDALSDSGGSDDEQVMLVDEHS